MPTSRAPWLLPLFLLAAPAWADDVYVRGGGRLRGIVVEETTDRVVLEVSAGRVTVPRSRVERVVKGTSALAAYRSRAAALAHGDVQGWLSLARWAEDQDLRSPSREAYEHVLALDPQNASAHRALGHVQVAGAWISEDEAYRARGYVSFEGRWMRPEERVAILAERSDADAARALAREADARAREAAARARVAEADARRAEAEAESARSDAAQTGIPYGWVLAGGGGPCVVDSPYCVDPRPPHRHRDRARRDDAPPPYRDPPPPPRRVPPPVPPAHSPTAGLRAPDAKP